MNRGRFPRARAPREGPYASDLGNPRMSSLAAGFRPMMMGDGSMRAAPGEL